MAEISFDLNFDLTTLDDMETEENAARFANLAEEDLDDIGEGRNEKSTKKSTKWGYPDFKPTLKVILIPLWKVLLNPPNTEVKYPWMFIQVLFQISENLLCVQHYVDVCMSVKLSLENFRKVISLCHQHGFIHQSPAVTGSGCNFPFIYGPLGTEIKRNILKYW
ncbi:hypothetical protein HOLleu_42810 [Holothuria leucospilota]|uniref:Uncharacterized protein n=1 Tax=Holothuria leucospilota TaxID=206669 RepID=A0A9Q1BBF0_HOLLE|nr:hypothetical protein HOLleu_42810 [Holothuria leucospilota]